MPVLNIIVLGIQFLKESWFMLCFILGYLWLGFFYRLPPHLEGQKQPVVLVPGFLGKGLEFQRLRKALIVAGHPVYIAPMGSQMGDIEGKKIRLANFLEDYHLENCLLIGYSMGGIVATGLDEKIWQRVSHFITIGVAFRGTPLAYFLPFFIASWQLMPQSNLITKYQKLIPSIGAFHTNIIAAGDEIAPRKSSLVATARQVLIPEMGHLNLVMGKKSIRQIIIALNLEK